MEFVKATLNSKKLKKRVMKSLSGVAETLLVDVNLLGLQPEE